MTRLMQIFLLSTAFVTGASVLCVELLGARVLTPFFGSGIYTWSALITITMAALALGYAWGGILADRYPKARFLYLLIFAAAVWVVITPVIAILIGPSMVKHVSFEIAVLLTSVILFFPSLFFLSSVSPFIIRLLIQQKDKVGMTSGRVFAVSTIGSLCGALLTGFFIVPTVSVSTGFLCCAGLLFLLAILGQFINSNSRLGSILIILSAISLLSGVYLVKSFLVKTDRVIDRVSSYYGQIQVVEKENSRVLLVDGVGQNYVSQGGFYTTAYINFMSALPILHVAEKKDSLSALVIGLGAGQIPMKYKSLGVETDVVELDEGVVTIAQKHFGFTFPVERVYTMDGRIFLTQNKKIYDYLLIDAFLADQIAGHMLTVESLLATKKHISQGGLLAINVVSTRGGRDLASIGKTLQSVFSYVQVYVYSYPTGLASHVIIASDKPVLFSLESYQGNLSAGRDVVTFLNNSIVLQENGVLLSDDFNPLDTMRRSVNQKWRRAMWSYLGEENLAALLN